MNILVTGNSSGLGLALTQAYLERGAGVYGISRRGCSLDAPGLHDCRCDLAQLEEIGNCMDHLLAGVDDIEVVFLNAGMLGPLQGLVQTFQAEIDQVMKVNVWSNKAILDWFVSQSLLPRQVALVSSGAAVRGGAGWNAYSLSKATLNMLAQLYAHEMPGCHLVALAPGLVDTAMQAFISDPAKLDIEKYPGFQRLRDARKDGTMPTAQEAARRIIEVLPGLQELPSGSFVDIRDL